MELIQWLAQHGHIAHTHQLMRAGFTRYAIRRAVERGVCARVRRDWLALPSAPAELRRVAAWGARIACLGVAERMGLWHLTDGRTHVSVARNACVQASEGVRIHWSNGPLPVPKYSLVEPIENALVHIADCQPFENALAVWDSALNKGVVTKAGLDMLQLRSSAARAVRAACSRLADSGIETIPVARLAARGIAVVQQVQIEGHRVDGLIGERLVLQIDGFAHHSSAAQRRSDIAHDRVLALLGYTVLRYDYKQVLFEWPHVEAEIVRAIGQGLHRVPHSHARQ